MNGNSRGLNFAHQFLSMRRLIIIFSCLFPVTAANAQERSLRIISSRSNNGISSVGVSGIRSAAVWLSDSAGFVRIPSDEPGPLRFSHISYQTRILQIDTGSSWTVRLSPLPYSLEGVTVLSPLARFRRDSAFNHSFFRRELADAKFKPGKKIVFIPMPGRIEIGIQWDGAISNFAMIATGKKRQYKRFARALKEMEAGKYAAIRYTTAMVSEQTGLPEDSAMAFIAKHPLDEDFLRSASELELRMRVREMYRVNR